jgi:hypothetical protein
MQYVHVTDIALVDNVSSQFKRNITSLTVPHSKSGIVPRSSLLGAGQLGFWVVGKGGTIG